MLYNQNWDRKSSIAALLNRAADVLEKRGHAKGILMDLNGNPCAIGALMVAEGKSDEIINSFGSGFSRDVLEAGSLVADAIDDDTQIGITRLASWNNQPERTKEEVIDKFREVAKELVAA